MFDFASQDVYRIYQLLTRLPSAISLLLQCTGPHGCVISVTLVEPLQVSRHRRFQFGFPTVPQKLKFMSVSFSLFYFISPIPFQDGNISVILGDST